MARFSPFKDPDFARAAGRLGAAERWAATVSPAERTRATAPARRAQYELDLTRAKAQADERGETLTEAELHERARQLRRALLARGRLTAMQNARRAAKS